MTHDEKIDKLIADTAENSTWRRAMKEDITEIKESQKSIEERLRSLELRPGHKWDSLVHISMSAAVAYLVSWFKH